MTTSKYDQITELLTSLSAINPETEKLRARWLHWIERFGVYDHINKKRYAGFFAWQQDKKLIIQEEKFLTTLLAMKELQQQSDKNFPNREEIKNVLFLLAETEFTKLELRQSRKLNKIQKIARGNLKKDMEELREKRTKLIDEIRSKKYSQQIESEKDLIATSKILNYHEKKFRWGKFIDTAEHVSTAAKTTKLGNFIFYLVNSFPNILNAAAQPFIVLSQNIANFLNGIPIVANIVAAIPILFSAAKSWFKNKSTTKKIFSTIAAVFAIAGIAAGATFFGLGLLTLGGFVGAGLAIVGFIALQVIPWARSLHKLLEAKMDLESTRDRINFLKEKQLTSLTESERDILLKRIEEAWLFDEFEIKTKKEGQVLEQAKQLIVEGNDISGLNQNPLIQAILATKTPSTLVQFLLEEHEAKRAHLKEKIKELKLQEREKAISMATSLVSVIGAVLICIPTPPTIIIGSIFLIGSAVAGFAIKYKWGEKIANLFNRIFAGKTEAPDMIKEKHQTDYKLTQEFAKHPDVPTVTSPAPEPSIEATPTQELAKHPDVPTITSSAPEPAREATPVPKQEEKHLEEEKSIEVGKKIH